MRHVFDYEGQANWTFRIVPGGSVTLAAAATHNQENNSGEYYQGQDDVQWA
jgi:hypothetical protein